MSFVRYSWSWDIIKFVQVKWYCLSKVVICLFNLSCIRRYYSLNSPHCLSYAYKLIDCMHIYIVIVTMRLCEINGLNYLHMIVTKATLWRWSTILIKKSVMNANEESLITLESSLILLEDSDSLQAVDSS